MRLVSPLLKHVVYPGLARTGYLGRRGGAGPAIVTYHGVLPRGYRVVDPGLDGSLVSAESFRNQLKLLKERYHVITPLQFLLWCESSEELPARSVLLTCDDGLRNTQTEMVPILQEFGLTCLFFVTGASLSDVPSMLWHEDLRLMLLCGGAAFRLQLDEIGLQSRATNPEERRLLWWRLVKSLSTLDGNARPRLLEEIRHQLSLPENWNARYLQDAAGGSRFLVLNLEGLKQLGAAGMSLGAHSLSHPVLSLLSSEAAWREIAESRHGLEQALGREVWALAYPFGDPLSVTQREVEMAERAGFSCAFLDVGGGFGAKTARFALPRVHVTGEMSLAEFEAHVSGFYGSLRRRFFGEADGAKLGPGT
jgi:peptidoglycan/xylan/chitin deacetylase (PgdA/CDA1 family)